MRLKWGTIICSSNPPAGCTPSLQISLPRERGMPGVPSRVPIRVLAFKHMVGISPTSPYDQWDVVGICRYMMLYGSCRSCPVF